MIHVPDVRATAAWYETIGFTLLEAYGDGGEGVSFAILSAGHTRLMLNQGGRVAAGERREVDFYVDAESVDQLFASLRDRVQVVEAVHDTDYGMREFIICDPNGFWITFGQQRATT
jgi:catechol 2,3-dioxygenase-like lactoylglutathione lyase family enzyme